MKYVARTFFSKTKYKIENILYDETSKILRYSFLGEQVMVMNLELDVPPTMDYLPHGTPVHTVDRETMAEAQFLAQQRKYWPSGFL